MPSCPGRRPIWDTVSIAVVENALDDKVEIVSDLVAGHANGRVYIASDLQGVAWATRKYRSYEWVAV